MANFKTAAGIIFLLTSPLANAETCGGADDDYDCCDTVASTANVTCVIPANGKYLFSLRRFGFENSDGDIHWVGSETEFDAASANIGSTMGGFVSGVPLPDGTYVAVRPELKLTFTINGSGLSTTDNVACTTGGDRTGDLGDVYVTEKMDFPTCAAEPNAFECDTGDGYMRIRDDQLGNFTISSTSTPTIDFKFDVGTGVLFTANGGACTFKSMGFLDATLTLSN